MPTGIYIHKPLSEETRRKLSIAHMGKIQKPHSEEVKKKISENNAKYWLGKKRSEETLLKMSKSLTGKKYGPHSDETKKKISKAHKGEKNYMFGKTEGLSPSWKGDNVGYGALHQWVWKIKGKAINYPCLLEDETCKGRMEWSNISSEYHRDVNDWQVLCTSHHKRYDLRKLCLI